MKWITSTNAIKCHLLFLTLGGLFIGLFLFGSKAELERAFPGNSRYWFLLFLFVGYPVVLFLLRFVEKADEVEAKRAHAAALTEPEKEKSRRTQWRSGSIIGLFAGACVLIFIGKMIGYLLLAFGVLGLLGVNVWYGGPLDPRNDPQIDEPLELQEFEESSAD